MYHFVLQQIHYDSLWLNCANNSPAPNVVPGRSIIQPIIH